MAIREYEENDIDGMIAVWNEIVDADDAFPQEEPLTHTSARNSSLTALHRRRRTGSASSSLTPWSKATSMRGISTSDLASPSSEPFRAASA